MQNARYTFDYLIVSVYSDDLKSLVYLKYCFKESLRLYPPVSVNGRVLASPTKFGNYEMPEGTVAVAIIYAVHHHPDFWENPEVRLTEGSNYCRLLDVYFICKEFDPLRFSPERSKDRHSYAFVPFSAGPR